MWKKIVPLFIVLILAAGGFFYWQNSQKDVKELNKTLPKGVKVVKSLFGNEYRVVNKIDGYEFKVPKEWMGVEEVDYVPVREEKGYVGTSLNTRGKESDGRVVGIDQFESGGNMNDDLERWAKSQSDAFGLSGDFVKIKINGFEVVKTQENVHFGGELTYFFRKGKFIYSLTSPSEDFIKYIILNGKW